MLALFPRSGFDQSVTTPVLVGVLVSWLFAETFGWVFAGLVVPGYLASVFLLDPAGGVIDIAETVVTYGVARAIGEHLPRLGITSRAFGRERFFLVVVVSILVRLAIEGWLLPKLAPRSAWAYSVGLVVVPLAANACWKTGLFRGAVQNGIPTLLVYVLLRWVLVPYTNLSLAGFELATENVAASFLGSPKPYILLVTGALLAAAANVRYGWDFNGILVPALLGLVVIEPVKLASTFVETLAIYGSVQLLLFATPLKRVNIEGPRRVVLFFTVDYALRFVWAAVAGRSMPGGDIVTFMGFGYLLPTLLAVKISQKSSVPLVLLPTAKVTLAGFVLGSCIGFGAQEIDHARAATREAPTPITRVMPLPHHAPAAAALWVSALALEGVPEPDSAATGDLALLKTGGDPARFVSAPLDGGTLLARERFESLEMRRGLPAVLTKKVLPARPLVALVPTPLACPACAAAAGELFARALLDAVVIAAIEEPSRASWLETTAHAAAHAWGGDVVEIRMASAETAAPTARVKALANAFPNSRAAAGVLVIDPEAIGRALSPARKPMVIESATAMAASFDLAPKIHVSTSLEDLVALRRLLLEPLLSSGASPSARAMAPLAATSLGYRLTAPSTWPGGGEGVALVPEAEGRPLAVFARTSLSDHARIVEAPLAVHRGTRDLALRFGVGWKADAIVIGEWYDAGLHRGAARAAHAAATELGSPSVAIIREEPGAPHVSLASWMDDGATEASARNALADLGIAPVSEPPSLVLRELATRTMLRPAPLVSISAPPEALEPLSLDEARRAYERLATLSVGSADGSLGAAAKALDAAIDPRRPVVSELFVENVRRAGAEGSAIATHRLESELREHAARAAIVSSGGVTYLLGVGRGAQSTLVVAARIDGKGDFSRDSRSRAQCMELPVVGVCEGR